MDFVLMLNDYYELIFLNCFVLISRSPWNPHKLPESPTDRSPNDQTIKNLKEPYGLLLRVPWKHSQAQTARIACVCDCVWRNLCFQNISKETLHARLDSDLQRVLFRLATGLMADEHEVQPCDFKTNDRLDLPR